MGNGGRESAPGLRPDASGLTLDIPEKNATFLTLLTPGKESHQMFDIKKEFSQSMISNPLESRNSLGARKYSEAPGMGKKS